MKTSNFTTFLMASIFLCSVLLSCSGGGGGGSISSSSNSIKSTLEFGNYPQSKIADGVTVDEKKKNAQGYFLGSDNNYYAKAIDNNYYKVEPIKWQVLSTDYNKTGKKLLVSEKILFPYPYRKDGTSSKYDESDIRKFLNNDFLNTAFSDTEKAKILVTEVDNSPVSTGDEEGTRHLCCPNTKDKTFLLSVKEIKELFNNREERIRNVTDFATGNLAPHVGSGDNAGPWWTRSPMSSTTARCVAAHDIGMYCGASTSIDYEGIVPALCMD